MSGWRPAVRDGVVAGGVATALLIAGLFEPQPVGPLRPAGILLLVGSGLALAVRRLAVVPVLIGSGLCALGYQAIGFDIPVIAFLFAVYYAMRAGHRIAAVSGSMVMLGSLLALAYLREAEFDRAFADARGALELAWLIAAGAAGEALRQAEQRAEAAERTAEETARRRADQERLHLARELHDSLTHQISVIKVQAESAVHIAQRRGEQVPAALLAIRDAAREAARELRLTVGVLRAGDAARGLDDVADLVQRFAATGLRATLAVGGDRHPVPAVVGQTGYRIVQEALTNVARHASAASATVRIDYRPDVLAIRVQDDGNSATSTGTSGVGLVGMGERVAALGGWLHAAPDEHGGFTVRAEIPLGGGG